MSAATRAGRPVTAMTEGEVRFLRKCVRFELGLRSTRPQPVVPEVITTWKRAEAIRELAKSFTESE